MIVTLPFDIIDPTAPGGSAILTGFSGGAQSDPPLWSVATTYGIGDRVRRDTTNLIYECLYAGVSGNPVPEDDVLTVAPRWIEVQYINKYAMFDYTRNTSTITHNAADSIIVELTPGIWFDCLYTLGMENIYKITISMMSGATEVYSYVQDQIASGIPIDHIDKHHLPTATSVITVTLQGNGIDTIACRYMVIGKGEHIGDIQPGISFNNINFSTVTRDQFGTANLVPRRSIYKIDYKLFLASNLVNKVLVTRTNLAAVPAVWYPMEMSEIEEYNSALVMVGVYKNFTIQLDNQLAASITLELEEI